MTCLRLLVTNLQEIFIQQESVYQIINKAKQQKRLLEIENAIVETIKLLIEMVRARDNDTHDRS